MSHFSLVANFLGVLCGKNQEYECIDNPCFASTMAAVRDALIASL